MSHLRKRLLFTRVFMWTASFMGFVVLAVTAAACKVPVFRYALERWESDPYRAVIFFHGGDGISNHVRTIAAPLTESTSANLETEFVDIDALTEAQTWEYEELESIGNTPVLRLYFPVRSRLEAAFWEGLLTESHVRMVLESPLRNRIVEEILQGSATTWVLVDSGNETSDAENEATLRRLLDRMEKNIPLPDGVINADEVSSLGVNNEGEPVELDDVLRSRIPLRIAFPVVRLSRADPAEAVFLAMLLGYSRTTLDNLSEALAIPVFGRGRCMPGIPASMINEGTVEKACRYLCGECSCQVKDQNPGIDLLLNVNWADKLKDNLVMIQPALPPFTGLTSEPSESPARTKHEHHHDEHHHAHFRWESIVRSVVISLGSLLILSFLGTVVLKRRGDS